MSEIYDAIAIFKFTDNLEKSGSQILDAQTVKHIFSLIVTIYHTKTETDLKNL